MRRLLVHVHKIVEFREEEAQYLFTDEYEGERTLENAVEPLKLELAEEPHVIIELEDYAWNQTLTVTGVEIVNS